MPAIPYIQQQFLVLTIDTESSLVMQTFGSCGLKTSLYRLVAESVTVCVTHGGGIDFHPDTTD